MRASTLTLCSDTTTNISRSSLTDMCLTCFEKPPAVMILQPIKAVLSLSLELEEFFITNLKLFPLQIKPIPSCPTSSGHREQLITVLL